MSAETAYVERRILKTVVIAECGATQIIRTYWVTEKIPVER